VIIESAVKIFISYSTHIQNQDIRRLIIYVYMSKRCLIDILYVNFGYGALWVYGYSFHRYIGYTLCDLMLIYEYTSVFKFVIRNFIILNNLKKLENYVFVSYFKYITCHILIKIHFILIHFYIYLKYFMFFNIFKWPL